MGYVTRALAPHERLLFMTGYHWLLWLGATILTAPAVAIVAAGYPFDRLDLAYLALSLIPLPFGLYALGRLVSTEVAVTSERFIKKVGLVSFTAEELGLENIEMISVEQSILGRILGYGNVTVHGTGQEDISVSMVNRPIMLRRQIQDARERARQPVDAALIPAAA